MTEDQMREAMLEDAKAIRKRAQTRDGQTQSLKQNVAVDLTWAAGTPSQKQRKLLTWRTKV